MIEVNRQMDKSCAECGQKHEGRFVLLEPDLSWDDTAPKPVCGYCSQGPQRKWVVPYNAWFRRQVKA